MSGPAAQSDNDKEQHHQIPEKCIQHYPSVWMSHWTCTSFKSVNEHHNQLSLHCGSGEDNEKTNQQPLLDEPEIETGSSKFVKEFTEMHKTFINESSTASLRNEPFTGQQFPMFKSSQNRDQIFSLKNRESSSHHGVLRSQVGPNSGYDVSLCRTDNRLPAMLELTPSKTETQSIDSKQKLNYVGIASNPEQQVKSNNLLDKNREILSASLKDEFLGSTSGIVLSEINGGRSPTEFFFNRQDDINQPSSSFLFHEKKMNNNAALTVHDPSTSNNQLRDSVSEQLQTMPNYSDMKLFPNQIRPPEARLYELPRIPSSLHDVETMRLCNTIDSVEKLLRGPPKLSQTTHHFLFTKKTDINLSDGGKLFTESAISSKFKGKSMSELLSLSPGFAFNVNQGVKLQPLDNSTESERTENIKNVHPSAVDLKNESSAETDTMDMDTLQQNHSSGVASFSLNKDIKEAQKLLISQAATALIREEIRDTLHTAELPDINQEPSVTPGVRSSADDLETSTSRTQSLNVEHFLSHAEHPTNSNSSGCVGPLGLDPFSRWVKRLKPSSSDSFALGTKSSKMGEATSHGKASKFFSKILNCSKNSSEPKMNKSHGKERMLINQTAGLLRKDEFSFIDSMRKCQSITLSHAWIRRWCHNAVVSSRKKPETAVVSDLQSPKATLDDLQKRQYPSIAAMALMGKAVTGFRPCEFRKKGSFVVWNTKELS